ncbi:MAG: hypothetical protein AAGI68_12110 [Planctomycetota bacterium]
MPESVPTDQELLDETRKALRALTAGGLQSFTTAYNQTYTRLQLKDLWAQIDTLEARIAEANDNGYGFVPTQMGEVC